jgi:hypothetical protein
VVIMTILTSIDRLKLMFLLMVLAGTPAWAQPSSDPSPPQDTVERIASDDPSEEDDTEEDDTEEDEDNEGNEETASDDAKDNASEVIVPKFLHVPPISAQAGKPLVLKGVLVGHWRVERIFAEVHRGDGSKLEVNFVRAREKGVIATIPGEWVERGGFGYTVRSIDKNNVTRDHFASPENLHSVSMVGFSKAASEQRQLKRFNNQRSRFTLRGNYTAYGRRFQDPDSLGGDFPKTDAGSDNLWLSQLEYLYRPLNFLHDFRFGIGVMRGAWPKVDGAPIHAEDAPGVNYGYGEINLEFHRWFSAGGRLILGANAIGFTMGAAGIARIGDLAGTHASAEIETIGNVGSRTDLRFTWTTVPKIPMALGIEFTNWPLPSAGAYAPEAANLYYDIAYELGAATVGLRLGNSKRVQSLDGGYQGGLSLSYGL